MVGGLLEAKQCITAMRQERFALFTIPSRIEQFYSVSSGVSDHSVRFNGLV